MYLRVDRLMSLQTNPIMKKCIIKQMVESVNIVVQSKQQSNLSVLSPIVLFGFKYLWTQYSEKFLFIIVAIGAVCHPFSVGEGVADWVMA